MFVFDTQTSSDKISGRGTELAPFEIQQSLGKDQHTVIAVK